MANPELSNYCPDERDKRIAELEAEVQRLLHIDEKRPTFEEFIHELREHVERWIKTLNTK